MKCSGAVGQGGWPRRTLVLYALDLLVRLVMSRSSTFWMALLMRRTSAGSPAAAMLRSRMDALQRILPLLQSADQRACDTGMGFMLFCITSRVRRSVSTQNRQLWIHIACVVKPLL